MTYVSTCHSRLISTISICCLVILNNSLRYWACNHFFLIKHHFLTFLIITSLVWCSLHVCLNITFSVVMASQTWRVCLLSIIVIAFLRNSSIFICIVIRWVYVWTCVRKEIVYFLVILLQTTITADRLAIHLSLPCLGTWLLFVNN